LAGGRAEGIGITMFGTAAGAGVGAAWATCTAGIASGFRPRSQSQNLPKTPRWTGVTDPRGPEMDRAPGALRFTFGASGTCTLLTEVEGRGFGTERIEIRTRASAEGTASASTASIPSAPKAARARPELALRFIAASPFL
jgi:hypothetical protein